MTPTLLAAALALAQAPAPPASSAPPGLPPGFQPAPANAPKGLAPMLTYVTGDDKGQIASLIYIPQQKVVPRTVTEKTPDGRTVTRQVQETVTEMQTMLSPLEEKYVKITTPGGKAVSYADAAKRVKGGAVVAMVFVWENKKADPAYLKALKDDTLVIEFNPPPPPPLPRGGEPIPGPKKGTPPPPPKR